MNARRYSIRRRLVWGNLACMAVILGGIGIAVNDVARHESEEIFSARLATSARVLEALVAHQLEKATIQNPIIIPLPKELDHASDDTPQALGHPYETKIAFQAWHDEGTLLAKSSSAPNKALAPLRAGFSKNDIDDVTWQVFTLHSGQVWIIAAEKDEIRQELSEYLSLSILGPLAAGGFLLLLAINLLLYFNLQPLRELASRISKRDPASLAPIALPHTPSELTPIVNELNDLLSRVKTAFAREQGFIDSAAHELRTPIAALQIHVQNAILAETEEERQASLKNALLGLQRTTSLAEQLLTFSRITAQSNAEEFRTVSLNHVCCEVIAMQEPLLAQRGQSIALEADAECRIMGEPYKLQRLVQNLIDNASQHGAPESEILVKLERDADLAVVSVINDGDPIPEQEMENIFRPYYRVPGSSTDGSGLGLAIVKQIAEQHQASIRVATRTDGRGTIISVAFALTKC
jgi:two-component system, OmpR family, sensor histidine kinase QseC